MPNKNDDQKNSTSSITPNPTSELSSSTNQFSYISKMKKYIGWNEMTGDKPNQLGDLIAHSYQILEQNYRHEYVFANLKI